MLDTLLTPLRLPQRVIGEIETIARSVQALSETADDRLTSVDDRAGELVSGLTALRASLREIDAKVDQLMGLDQTIETKMEGLREDLNARMLAVEHEVRAMQPPMNQMARDVAKIDGLLPNPHDGPLTRLKDTLTSSTPG